MTNGKASQNSQEKKYFWTLVVLALELMGLGLSIYWTLSNEYVSLNKNVNFHSGPDLDVIVTAENYTKLTWASFLYPKTAVVTMELYSKSLPIFVDSIEFASNDSYILRTNNVAFKPVHNTEYHKTNPIVFNYTIRLKVGHQLTVANYNVQDKLFIHYGKDNDALRENVVKIPFIWHIQTLDWNILFFFWIIFTGVFVSRLLTARGGKTFKFAPHELGWVVISAILALLTFKISTTTIDVVFGSFTAQLFHRLSANILTNLAIAFAYGFVFDKVLERWRKSPRHLKNLKD